MTDAELADFYKFTRTKEYEGVKARRILKVLLKDIPKKDYAFTNTATIVEDAIIGEEQNFVVRAAKLGSKNVFKYLSGHINNKAMLYLFERVVVYRYSAKPVGPGVKNIILWLAVSHSNIHIFEEGI